MKSKDNRVMIYTPCAKAKGKAKAWVRNVDIWVLELRPDVPFRTMNSAQAIVRKYFCGRVDSRYKGTRSAYHAAMAEAVRVENAWAHDHVPV